MIDEPVEPGDRKTCRSTPASTPYEFSSSCTLHQTLHQFLERGRRCATVCFELRLASNTPPGPCRGLIVVYLYHIHSGGRAEREQDGVRRCVLSLEDPVGPVPGPHCGLYIPYSHRGGRRRRPHLRLWRGLTTVSIYHIHSDGRDLSGRKTV
jgi:hypothetical protein